MFHSSGTHSKGSARTTNAGLLFRQPGDLPSKRSGYHPHGGAAFESIGEPVTDFASVRVIDFVDPQV
jgi:hypothetical protein